MLLWFLRPSKPPNTKILSPMSVAELRMWRQAQGTRARTQEDRRYGSQIATNTLYGSHGSGSAR